MQSCYDCAEGEQLSSDARRQGAFQPNTSRCRGKHITATGTQQGRAGT